MSTSNTDWNQQIIEQFRVNGGTVDRFGDALVLLHHTGARTGVERVTPVMAIREDADTRLIAASKAGAPDNPAWFHNLLAHPDVDIETPEGVVPVHVTRLECRSVTRPGRGSRPRARGSRHTRRRPTASSRCCRCTVRRDLAADPIPANAWPNAVTGGFTRHRPRHDPGR